MTNPSPPYLLISDNTSNDDTANNEDDNDNLDNDDNDDDDKNPTPNTVKTAATKKTKAAAPAPKKKAGTKMTGEEVIDIDTPPKEEAACRRPGRCILLDQDPQGVHGQPLLQGE
jgi:hypothetical protein